MVGIEIDRDVRLWENEVPKAKSAEEFTASPRHNFLYETGKRDAVATPLVFVLTPNLKGGATMLFFGLFVAHPADGVAVNAGNA